MPSPRSRALGGDHVAYTSGVDALFVNPAELRERNAFSLLSFSAGIVNPLWLNEAAVGIMGEGDSVEVITGLLGSSGGRIPIGLDIQGPLALGFVAGGFGIGLFDRVHIDARIIGTDVYADVNADAVANIGYAMRFVDTDFFKVDAGIVGKAFGRAQASIDASALTIAGDLLGENANTEIGAMLKTLGVGTVPLYLGGSADIGASVKFSFIPPLKDRLTIALVYNDVFSYAQKFMDYDAAANQFVDPPKDDPNNYMIKPALKLGASYSIALGNMLKISAMVDHGDVFALYNTIASADSVENFVGRNWLLDLNLGAEVTLFNIISLRAGVADLMPTAGIGLNLFVFKLDAAIYGKELGTDPGDFSTYAVDVGLSFSW
jgi:hypothetical protein